MRVDAHAHLFTPAIMDGMARRPAMLRELALDVEAARTRLPAATLAASARRHGLDACVLLPSAGPDAVRRVNRRHWAIADADPRLRSLGTLHPAMDRPDDEIDAVLARGIAGIKLSTFSQRFSLDDPATDALLARLARAGEGSGARPVVVLDTYTRAEHHFGADPRTLTTPSRLVALAARHPALSFVGAHMGGLAAPPDELLATLRPADNLYLDTSNAAHVLDADTFVTLCRRFGAARLLFGTDWPWFGHADELPKVRGLLARAGFDEPARDAVLGGNAARLYGLARDTLARRRSAR